MNSIEIHGPLFECGNVKLLFYKCEIDVCLEQMKVHLHGMETGSLAAYVYWKSLDLMEKLHRCMGITEIKCHCREHRGICGVSFVSPWICLCLIAFVSRCDSSQLHASFICFKWEKRTQRHSSCEWHCNYLHANHYLCAPLVASLKRMWMAVWFVHVQWVFLDQDPNAAAMMDSQLVRLDGSGKSSDTRNELMLVCYSRACVRANESRSTGYVRILWWCSFFPVESKPKVERKVRARWRARTSRQTSVWKPPNHICSLHNWMKWFLVMCVPIAACEMQFRVMGG